jgi:hypothetical protein
MMIDSWLSIGLGPFYRHGFVQFKQAVSKIPFFLILLAPAFLLYIIFRKILPQQKLLITELSAAQQTLYGWSVILILLAPFLFLLFVKN